MWDLFEGKHLFYGDDPDGKGYSTRAHLAEVMGILGPPPMDMLQHGKRRHEFFTSDGKYRLSNALCKGLTEHAREMEARCRHPNRSQFGAVRRVS